MPSTYTLNNGIELIGTGEQSGTWGDTTNTNLELLDTALDGQVSITLAATGSSGSPNSLPISDGASSNGRNRLVIFGDGGDLGGTAFVQLTPNDAEKIIYVRNNLSGSRSILLFQGTYNASNDYEVPAGTTAVVFFNGAGTGAVAANVFNNAFFDSLRLGGVSVTAIIDDDTMATASATNIATSESIKAYVDTQVGANNELSEVLANGNTTGGNAIQMTTTDELQFRDTALKISSSADGQLDIDADTEIEIVAPTVDIDASTAMTIDTAALTVTGAVDLNTSLNVDGTVTSDGVTVAGNLSVDGGTIKLDGNYPTGSQNVALGDAALDDGSLSGGFNTAIGRGSLSNNTSGAYNSALGNGSLQNNITANSNVGVGYQSLYLNTTGAKNVAVGTNALDSNVTGSNNVSIGFEAGDALGEEIVATALVSGVNYTIQTLGTTDFTLIGASSNTVGSTFTATGAGSGTGTASANAGFNTFIGYQSGDEMIGGSRNTILGSFNGNQNTVDIRNSNYNIVISDGNGNPRMFYNNSVPELVFNEQGSDVDFRVESNSNANAIFLNAGDGRLGLFTGSPLVKFQIGDFGSNTSKSGQAALVESSGFTLNFDTGGNFAGSTHRINFIDRHGAASQGTDGQIGAYIEAARDGSSSTIDLNLGAVNNNAGDAGELMSITANNGIINKTYPVIEMTAPQLIFNRTDRGTDLKKWRLAHSSEHLEIQALNDAESAAYSSMKFERTATGTTTTIVNPDSRNVGDFQVKSANYNHMLFVDAGEDTVTIGGSDVGTHAGMFNVAGNLGVITGSGNPTITIKTGGTGNNPGINYRAGDNIIFDNTLIASAATDYWRVGHGSSGSVTSEVLVVTTDSRVGINDTTPSYTVDVRQLSNSADDGVNVQPNNATQNMRYSFLGTTSSYFTEFMVDSTDSGTAGFRYFKFYEGTRDNNGELLYLGYNGTVFNEGGADRDFRVESASSSYAIHMDSDISSVGLNVQADSSYPLLISHNGHGIGAGYVGGTLPDSAGIYTSSNAAHGGLAYGSLVVQARANYSGYGVDIRASGSECITFKAGEAVWNGGVQSYSDNYSQYASTESVTFTNSTAAGTDTFTSANNLPYQRVVPVVISLSYIGNGAISYSVTALVYNGLFNQGATVLQTVDSDGGAIMGSVSLGFSGSYNSRKLTVTITTLGTYAPNNWDGNIKLGATWN